MSAIKVTLNIRRTLVLSNKTIFKMKRELARQEYSLPNPSMMSIKIKIPHFEAIVKIEIKKE